MSEIHKTNQYAITILGKLQELFSEESDYHIDQKELYQGDNLTHFMHALANIVPTQFYNKVTGEDKNFLEFNHLANTLAFQYSTRKEDEDE